MEEITCFEMDLHELGVTTTGEAAFFQLRAASAAHGRDIQDSAKSQEALSSLQSQELFSAIFPALNHVTRPSSEPSSPTESFHWRASTPEEQAEANTAARARAAAAAVERANMSPVSRTVPMTPSSDAEIEAERSTQDMLLPSATEYEVIRQAHSPASLDEAPVDGVEYPFE